MFLDGSANLPEIAKKFSCSIFYGDPDEMLKQFQAELPSGRAPRTLVFEKDAKKAGITVDVSQELVRLNTALPASTPENPNFLVVKNAELLNEHASNALLKTFEEARQFFVLLAHPRARILPTIISRSAVFHVPFGQKTSAEASRIAESGVVEMANSLDKKPELALEVLNLLFTNLAHRGITEGGSPSARCAQPMAMGLSDTVRGEQICEAARAILAGNSVKLAFLSYL
jgi:hypothetical protein